LARPVAERVARHLVATGRLIGEDPELAFQHATTARRLAPRIAAVREAVGVAAYQAGDWATAISDLRAYQRMSGRQSYLAVLADCERALGRPEKAIDLFRSADRAQLDPEEAIELLVVASGARRDLGQAEAAAAMLQVRELTQEAPWSARLRYAYADALLGIGRTEEAREWFARAAEVDDEASTDATERLLELDGVQLDEDESEEDESGEEESGEAEEKDVKAEVDVVDVEDDVDDEVDVDDVDDEVDDDDVDDEVDVVHVKDEVEDVKPAEPEDDKPE
jgi:tetratricopeptide (TPR) repeat protein